MNWYRSWVRKKVGLVSIDEAQEKKYFWSKIYAITGLGALAFCTYMTYNKRQQKDLDYVKKNPFTYNPVQKEKQNFQSAKENTEIRLEENKELEQTKEAQDKNESKISA